MNQNSQLNISNYHRSNEHRRRIRKHSIVVDWPHCCDFLGDTCDDLRWSAMLLLPQNRRKTAYFIAACGQAYTHVASKGSATRCDDAHLRGGVPKLLRCREITWDALRCQFQHVQYFAPDFRISQPFIICFSNDLHHCDGDLISFM